MIKKRVMLIGGVVVGVSYALAAERVSPVATSSHPEEREIAPTVVSAPVAAHDNTEVRALAAELGRMKGELEALRDDLPAEPAPVRPEPAPPKTPEQLQAEHDEYMAGVERAFDQEPRDARWADGVAQRVRQTLETEPVMLAAVRGIECRSRSCRLELRDDGSSQFAEELPLIMHQMGALLPEVRFGHAEVEGGARVHIMYMTQSASDEL